MSAPRPRSSGSSNRRPRPAIWCRSSPRARGLRWHARLPAGRAELVKVLGSLHGSVPPEVAQERISDYEAYRIHVMQDEQMAERVGRRFSNFHVAGRDPVNMQRDEGPRPGTEGRNRRVDRAVRSGARRGSVHARGRAESHDARRADETIESMAAVRGRKSIILMSPGFILDQELVLFRQVEDAARRANIAMYLVDARGLEVQSVFASAQFGSPLDSRDIGAANADSSARSGGGSGARRIERRLRRAEQQRSDRRPSPDRPRVASVLPARIHAGRRPCRRQVPANHRAGRTARRAGARPKGVLRGRRAPRGPPTRAATTDALETALHSPYDLAALPVRAAAYVFGNVNATEASVLLAVEADLRAFRPQGERRRPDGRARFAPARHQSGDRRDEALRAHRGNEPAERVCRRTKRRPGIRCRSRSSSLPAGTRPASRCAIETAAAWER